MDVQEIVRKKKELEAKIASTLDDFCKETGLSLSKDSVTLYKTHETQKHVFILYFDNPIK